MPSQISGSNLLELAVSYTNTLDINRRRMLAKFADVHDQTVRQWQRGTSTPSGRSALKLNYLLEWVGIANPQWRATEPVLLDAGRLLAFGVINEETMCPRFGDGSVDEKVIIQMLSGYRHVKSSNMDVFAQLVQENFHLLDAARNKWTDLLVTNKRDQILSDTANKLQALLPIAEELGSDEWTPEERHDLRQRSGRDTIFRLYNALGALCGEKARSITMRPSTTSRPKACRTKV